MSSLRVIPNDLVCLEARAEIDLLSPATSREDVLARIDPDHLRTGPLNVLTSTAIAISAPDMAAAVEDALLRQTEALTSEDTALAAHARISAENLVLANLEHKACLSAYAAAETAAPVRAEWKNPQHYLEALRIHERRMDRLLRATKDAYERVEKAAGIYRTALLTRDGLEILNSVSERRPRPASGGYPEVLPAQTDTKNIVILVK